MYKTKILKFKLKPVVGDKLTLAGNYEFVVKEVKKRWFRPTEVTVELKIKLE